MNSRIAVIAAAGLLTACSARPAPAPMNDPGIDLKVLDGEWSGTYKATTGRIRTGKLLFSLQGLPDEAKGNVVVTYLAEPATTQPYLYPAPPIESDPLPIAFTRAPGNRVSGRLESLFDPYCGCEYRTVFAGRVKGDKIEGTFTMQQLQTKAITWGEWKASKLPPKVIVE